MKPFQTKGLVRRVTPFMGAGLIALVVFSDPTFSRLAWADALAVLLVFPLYLTSVLFAALYDTSKVVGATTALASIGILVLSISGGRQPGQPAISILVVAVLWVVVLTVHAAVAQRKHSEDSVRALNAQLVNSRARLQAIVDTSLNAIVGMDESGRVTDWNPHAAPTFGWSRDEILGKTLADTIVPEQHRAAHRAGLAHYLTTGDGPVLGKVLELTAIDRTGREFPVELSISRASSLGDKALFVGL